ncbi:MAG: VOC family protein [Candidatus Saccharibacteria bacterium]
MLGQSYSHANFSVDDLAAARSFYVDKLGFSVVRQTDDELLIESGKGSQANIYYKADHTPWDSTVFGIEVDDMTAALDELKAQGIDVEKVEGTDERGVMSDPTNGEATWFKDPAGNWVCVSQKD